MTRLTSHTKGLLIAAALLIVSTLTLPVIPYLWTSFSGQSAAATDLQQENPRASFWRSVRRGNTGYTTIQGREAGVYIHGNGINWREYRSNLLVPYGGYLMGMVLCAIVIFFTVRGQIHIKKGLSGKSVERFSVYQRTIHWFTAVLFWLLALSGLVLLYGRYILIPLLGSKGFAITAAACKEAHNLFGPIFLLALVLMMITFIRDNLYQKGDIKWLKRGGGMFGSHASAGKFNLGEKIWFWLVCVLGLSVSVSGIALDFSILGLDRNAMDLAHVIHSAGAILFIALSFGHIYLGTIGTQGTLEGMTRGSVDSNWAELHHDRWIADTAAEKDVATLSSVDIAGGSRE
jgi:formate dehydrogenase subunit gamma